VIVARKAALSLLISTLLFAVFTALAFTGLFDLVEARFYNPAVARALGREIDADTQVIENFFEELRIRFAATLDEGAVKRSLLSTMESEDIARRESLYGELLESLGGLQSVRLIDSGGRRIHFSTWAPDILRRDRNSIAYRNYGAEENSAAYIPYGQVEAATPGLILDGAGERIVFALPFYDSFDVYRGTALFSLSVRAVMDALVSAGRIKIGEDVSVVSEPPGLIIGLPSVGRKVLLSLAGRMWSENSLSLGRLNADLTGLTLVLISRKTEQNLYIGLLANESLLGFPVAMRIILLLSFFITVCLIIFLIFNFRQDDITILQSRLKKLQVNLIEEYYEHRGALNWSRWKQELEHRREDIYSELKRGLGARINTGDLAEIDSFINRSWDDLMTLIGGHIERRTGISDDTLKDLLSRLLPEPAGAPATAEAEKPEEIEALDEADIVEALEGPLEETMIPPPPEPELMELEPGELEELAEPETGDPEPELTELEAEELAEPESEAPMAAEPEAPEPELAELEAAELELAGLEDEGSEPMAEFRSMDLLEFECSGGSPAINNLASVIEFSPDSKEFEQEKDDAAKSMAEHFEIQSPASIFSTLSELEFKPEPMEDLEALESERPAPDDSPATEAEELRSGFAGPQFSIPFLGTLNSELAFLTAEGEDAPVETDTEELKTAQAPDDTDTGGVVTERDGVIYINESVLSPDRETLKGLNKNFKNLIDSILNNT
jgi:hypothetical protein